MRIAPSTSRQYLAMPTPEEHPQRAGVPSAGADGTLTATMVAARFRPTACRSRALVGVGDHNSGPSLGTLYAEIPLLSNPSYSGIYEWPSMVSHAQILACTLPEF